MKNKNTFLVRKKILSENNSSLAIKKLNIISKKIKK
jgi:hypothetical protein